LNGPRAGSKKNERTKDNAEINLENISEDTLNLNERACENAIDNRSTRTSNLQSYGLNVDTVSYDSQYLTTLEILISFLFEWRLYVSLAG